MSMTKKNLLKSVATLALSLGMVVGMASMAFAAQKTVINHVNLHFDTSEIEAGSGEKKIAVDSSDEGFDVAGEEGVATNMSGSRWLTGNVPEFKVTLRADEDHKFNTSSLRNSGYYTLSGDKVYFVKSSGTSNSLTLYVKMAKLSNGLTRGDLKVEDADWNEDTRTATWNGGNYANRYTLKLYKGNVLLTTVDTTNSSYDFSNYITTPGNYKYKIRAYYDGSYGEWATSDEFNVDNDYFNDHNIANRRTTAGWLRDNTGWWYRNANGSYTTNNWQLINGRWYFFNANGYMVTGWIQWKGAWYFLNADGGMATGWVQSKGLWYYMSGSGSMLSNTRTPDGYYVNGDGVWVR